MVHDVVLGLDFLNSARAIVNLDKRRLEFRFDITRPIEFHVRTIVPQAALVEGNELDESTSHAKDLHNITERFEDVITRSIGRCDFLP